MIVRKITANDTPYIEPIPPGTNPIVLIPQNDEISTIMAGLRQLKADLIKESAEGNVNDISVYNAKLLLSVVTILEDLKDVS